MILPRPRVAVFGSANLTGQPAYHAQITELGRQLANHRLDIYIGSTTGLINCFLNGLTDGKSSAENNVNSNTHLVVYGDQRYTSMDNIDTLIHQDDYFSRLSLLCEADIFIVLDGQLGTMAETIVCWNRLQANMDFNRKIIIFGEQEKTKIEFLLDAFVFSKTAYRELVCFADNVMDIVTLMEKSKILPEPVGA